MSFYQAKKCFDENLQLFTNSQDQPEKYNLYAGLSNLANELDNLNTIITDIQHKINYIHSNQK